MLFVPPCPVPLPPALGEPGDDWPSPDSLPDWWCESCKFVIISSTGVDSTGVSASFELTLLPAPPKAGINVNPDMPISNPLVLPSCGGDELSQKQKRRSQWTPTTTELQ